MVNIYDIIKSYKLQGGISVKKILLLCLLLISCLVCSLAYGKGVDDTVITLLEGYWEPGNRGTRVEIHEDEMTVLWLNRPVLVTKFTVTKENEEYVLHLQKNGLRYAADAKDYATVTGCSLKDGKLYFSKHFPISGPSDEVLSKTTNSRYGNVDIITDQALPRLQGIWRTIDGSHSIKIQGNTLSIRFREYDWEKPEKIAVVRYRWEQNPERFRIVNQDPAQEYICHLTEFRHENGKLITCMPVFDAPRADMVFVKIE